MVEAKQGEGWAHTSAMLAQIANVGGYMFAKHPRGYSPTEFNPTTKKQKVQHSAAHKLAVMKYLWTDAK